MLSVRYELAISRIREIDKDNIVREPFVDYFKNTASLLSLVDEVKQQIQDGSFDKLSSKEHKELNDRLYADVVGAGYDISYCNPTYIASRLASADADGKLSKYLCFLATEMRGLIPYAFEGNEEILVLYMELFLEVYGMFETAQADETDTKAPDSEEVRQCLYWFQRDNLEVVAALRICEQIDPARDFATKIIMESDLSNTDYLYRFGEYITDNELKTAEYINSLPEEDIEAMARTYTEGYRIGFVKGGKDLSKKTSVDVRFCLGFERMIKKAIEQFAQLGLKPVVYRAGSLSLNKKGQHRIGYYGAIANKQYDYDHREDEAIYLDKDYVNRRLEVIRATYEENKQLAYGYAGPAVVEVFGEEPFLPEDKKDALALSRAQQKTAVEYADKNGRLTNEYIKGEERSFTIIAYPLPCIGEKYKEIFSETVKLNTLDYQLYENMQQIIIDVLDTARTVHIVGRNGNDTDLTVALYELNDPATETIFENCVADVNIPVGEVFTSPKLKGTNGLLHVKEVYLNELKYVDIRLTFKDGVITDYTCKNFEDEEANKKYIKDNLLFHHDTLPMGEFAIGTNTTAYKMAKDYEINDLLPILIGEKTGPHFAVGDTCYSHEEDIKSYNPDGKSIVARSNDFSDLRDSQPDKAYFHCHTDITIPYDELGGIYAISADGDKKAIIVDGLFVLDGLEELNKPLKK